MYFKVPSPDHLCRTRALLFWALATLIPYQSFACEVVRAPIDYLQCVVERSPEIVAAQAEAESAQDLIVQAGRWLNPELEGQNLFGMSLGYYHVENQFSLLQPIQLGGKRDARVATATARAKKATAERDIQLSAVVGEALSQLLRSIQIRQEMGAIESAIGAYRRMVANLRRRTVLSPEQRATLALFQANIETLENSSSTLAAEQKILKATLVGILSGQQIDWRALDRFGIADWPELSPTTNATLAANPNLRNFESLQDIAAAEYQSASAEAWPDLRLGPMLQFNTEGPIKFQQYGFGVTMALPIWDLRGPAKRAALRVSEAAHLVYETRLRQQAILVKEKQEAYVLLQNRIADRTPIESFERYLGSVESQFARGVLGPPQVIEAYRQRIENLRSRFEVERQALSLIVDIWTARGEVFEKTLSWAKTSWAQGGSK